VKIGIIGAATVGRTLAAKFAKSGQDVLLANSRSPGSLSASLSELDALPTATSSADLLASAEIVFLCLPWVKAQDVLTPDIDWNGRILVDTTNIFASYAPDFQVDDLKGDSGSEIVARLAPSAQVVKAFNTVPFATMFAAEPAGTRRVLFVAGDDAAATSTVAKLIRDVGLHPIVLGPLASAGHQMELGGIFSGLELFTAAKEEIAS
jgi:8-hydroxy-5-deazaflavin:NADPH oxidoreductase